MNTRKIGFLLATLAAFVLPGYGQTIYVSTSGNDANPGTQAQPKATLQAAFSAVADGGTVKVSPGTYNGKLNVALRSGITLEGAANLGDPKPVLSLNTGGTNQVLLAFDGCTNMTVRGFQLDVDQTFLLNGLTTIGNCDNLLLSDLRIRAFGTNPTIHSGAPNNPTHGLQLDGSNVSNFPRCTLENITTEPTIGPNQANTWYFDRGVLLRGMQGNIGGTSAQTCTFKAARDILIQFNGGGLTKIENNVFNGGGIDITYPKASGTFQILGNTFAPDARGAFLISELILLKQNANSARIEVDNNQITGYSNVGLRAGGVANAFVRNNVFLPSDTSRSFRSIEVNTLWEGTTQTPTVSNSITIAGNDFRAPAQGAVRGIAVFLKNERPGASTPDYDFVSLGGAGTAANKFAERIARFIRLDNQISRTFSLDLDGSQNLYEINGVPTLPAAMSQADLFKLEDKFDHAIDDETVGLIRVRPKALYVTPASFYRPNTSLASVQRAILKSAGTDTVHIRDSIYQPPVFVDKDLTFKPSGTQTVLGDLTMVTPANTDELRLDKTISLSGQLSLTQGKIRLNTSNLRMLAPTPASPPPGSADSYVMTDGTGKLVLVGLASSPRNFPIGTAAAWRPVIIANAGAADTVSLRIKPNVLSQALTGTPIDTVVDFTWFFSEGTPGGGNYTFQPQWTAADERPNFFRNRTFLQRWNGTRWEFLTGPVPNYLPITGADPFVATASSLTQSFSFDTPLRIYGPKEIPDTIFYVDGVDGQDDFPNRSGRTPEFAWKSINYAVANATRVAPSRYIYIHVKQVAPAYDGAVVIPADKSRLFLRGGYLGTDIAPVVSNTLSPDPVLTVSADTVFIDKLNLQVGLSGARVGFAGLGSYQRLTIDSSLVRNVSGATLGTGIELTPVGAPQVVSITSCQLFGDQPTGTFLRYGILAGNVGGTIGGSVSTSNRIAATTGIEVDGANGIPLRVAFNTLQSDGVGIRLAEGNAQPLVLSNIIGGGAAQANTGIQVFGFTDAGLSVRVDSNTVTADTCLLLADNRTASASANILVADSINIHVNSGIAGRTLASYVTGNVTLLANVLQGLSTRADGLVLGNAAKASINPAFDQVVVGTTTQPNVFPQGLQRFIVLDYKAGIEFDKEVDARNNRYGVTGGLKLPTAMTQDELWAVEDKIVHKIDFAGLGLARVRDNELYVTPNSFISPRTGTPALQRTVPPSADGDKVFILDGVYPDTTTIDKNLTFTSKGNDTQHKRMQMRGNGKVLTIVNNFTLTGGLELTDGKIKLSTNNLVLTASCPQPEGGSINSHVWTSGTGGLVQNNLGPGGKADSLLYPVGLDLIYNPIYLNNKGTADDYRVRLLPDVLTAGLQGGPVPDSVVKASWVITELTNGGSDLHVRPFWAGAQEKAEFDRDRVGIQGFFGGVWVADEVLSRTVSGSDPYSAGRGFPGRSFSETPIRVISLPPLKDAVFIPTLFTPNEDGTNDILLVYSNTLATIDLRIYNRYGNIVYQTTDVNEALTKGWDGTSNGQKCGSDTYVWNVTGTYKNGKSIDVLGRRTGYVILSR